MYSGEEGETDKKRSKERNYGQEHWGRDGNSGIPMIRASYRLPPNQRFIIGLKNTDKVRIDISQKCEGLQHCEITNFPHVNLNKSFTNVYGLKEALEKVLIQLKGRGNACL